MTITCGFLLIFPFPWDDKGILRVASSGNPEIPPWAPRTAFRAAFCSSLLWLLHDLCRKLNCFASHNLFFLKVWFMDPRVGRRRCLVGGGICSEKLIAVTTAQPPAAGTSGSQKNCVSCYGKYYRNAKHRGHFLQNIPGFYVGFLNFLLENLLLSYYFPLAAIREFPTLWDFFRCNWRLFQFLWCFWAFWRLLVLHVPSWVKGLGVGDVPGSLPSHRGKSTCEAFPPSHTHRQTYSIKH